jgi:hypothetical protein
MLFSDGIVYDMINLINVIMMFTQKVMTSSK